MKLYKLTDENGMTFNDTQWGPGVSHSGTGEGGLCGPGWIHAYEHPLIAVLMNPEHAGFDPDSMRLWEAEGEVGLRDGQLKCGSKTLTTVREIPVPEITTEMCARFAILCAKEVCREAAWNKWADGWLSGEDRSEAEASKAACAAWAASEAARASAAVSEAAVSEAAWAAAWAARASAAVSEAAVSEAACAAWAASEAASEAACAAWAAWAARAARAASEVDLFAIAETACAG